MKPIQYSAAKLCRFLRWFYFGGMNSRMAAGLALAVHAVAGFLSSETRRAKLAHRANVRDVVDGSEQESRLRLSKHLLK
jgi:hypothetical protein